MSLTKSQMKEIGSPAPSFFLPDITGKQISINDYQDSELLLIIFMCNHCPYVVHLREHLVSFIKEYQKKGIGVIGINSNDANSYPEDSLQKMKEYAEMYNYTFPYLYDETQEVAKAYHAACTPDFFLYDKNRSLAYRGQYDASRPGNGIEITGKDLKNAIDSLLRGKKPEGNQIPSIGCNIKWKPGNEPDYF